MGYNATYDSADIGSITVDGVASIFAAIVGFATLVGLVLLYGWFKKNVK